MTVTTFAEPDVPCVPPSRLVVYRCSPDADPVAVTNLKSRHPRRYMGGRFGGPVRARPDNVTLSGFAPAMLVIRGGTPPDLYVREKARLEQWLPLPSRSRVTGHARAFVIGDSVMLAAEHAVARGLHGWQVSFDAKVSRTTYEGITIAERIAARSPDVVVVELGTNESEAFSFGGRARQMLNSLRRVPLVVWLTVHGPARYVPSINGEIRLLVSEYPNAVLADWNGAVPPGGLRADGIHPTPVGDRAMARLVDTKLRSWVGAATGGGDTACEVALKGIG